MRKFGLEIEFIGSIPRVVEEFQNAGMLVVDSSHTHFGFSQTHWTVKRDGSVSRGGELVSPPLDFDDPDQRKQVTDAVGCLQRSGAVPDETAGIHVHIEAKHADGSLMTAREVAAIVRFTYKFEDAIYRIASSGWETLRSAARSYAKPIPEATAQAIMKVRTSEELRRVWNGYDLRAVGGRDRRARSYDSVERYVGTNLHSYFDRSKGTVEFRYFNSSINPDRVQTYIALCMAIVQDARNGYSRSVKKSYRLGDMASGRVTEKAVFLRLQQVLRTNSRDTTICMSKEDWTNLRKLCWAGSKAQAANAAGRIY